MVSLAFSDYLFPQKVAKFSSEFNSQVEVVKFMGKYRLDMGDLTQSGEVIKEIWGTAIKATLPHRFTPENILILGLGAGSLAHLLTKKYPRASLTGVEIDPVVIEVARKYFRLDSLSRLSVVTADAVSYINNLDKNTSFDLIFFDCYIGDKVPPALENPRFLKTLYRHLSPGGFMLINRLFWGKYTEQAEVFVNSIGRLFGTYKLARTMSNLLLTIPKH